jgi:hypothetical protein
MGRKKNPNKKTTEQIVRDALEKEQVEFKEGIVALKNFDAPKKKQANDRQLFATFWASNKKEYGREKDREIEDVLWAHLRASGMNKPELFKSGMEHFGLKKK